MKKNRLSFYFLSLFPVFIFLFLYIPIIVLIVFSFNKSPVPYVWSGFSFEWYYNLFRSPDLVHALLNSLVVAVTAMLLSAILGVFFVFFSAKRYVGRLLLFSYANLALPEVVIAVGLLSLFSYYSITLGLTTLIAGHTLMGLAYVIPLLQTRFAELDAKFTEASRDLGASDMQTLMRIILPLLRPALIASSLLVFIVSLDDFVISFFTAGAATQTLPMYIFSVIRSGATPEVNALSTILLVTSSLIVVVLSLIQTKKLDIL